MLFTVNKSLKNIFFLMKQRQFASFSSFSPIVSQRWPEMAPVLEVPSAIQLGTDPAQFLDSVVTSFASLGPGWHGIGGMTLKITLKQELHWHTGLPGGRSHGHFAQMWL